MYFFKFHLLIFYGMVFWCVGEVGKFCFSVSCEWWLSFAADLLSDKWAVSGARGAG